MKHANDTTHARNEHDSAATNVGRAHRLVRLPIRSAPSSAAPASACIEHAEDTDNARTCEPGSSKARRPEDAFALWASQRNRRLIRLAANRPQQPPPQPAISHYATAYLNHRSNNKHLDRLRRPGSSATLRLEPPALVRGISQHPWVVPPTLPKLQRRHLPSLLTLMILVWVAVIGAGVSKALKPPSGVILTLDR